MCFNNAKAMACMHCGHLFACSCVHFSWHTCADLEVTAIGRYLYYITFNKHISEVTVRSCSCEQVSHMRWAQWAVFVAYGRLAHRKMPQDKLFICSTVHMGGSQWHMALKQGHTVIGIGSRSRNLSLVRPMRSQKQKFCPPPCSMDTVDHCCGPQPHSRIGCWLHHRQLQGGTSYMGLFIQCSRRPDLSSADLYPLIPPVN